MLCTFHTVQVGSLNIPITSSQRDYNLLGLFWFTNVQSHIAGIQYTSGLPLFSRPPPSWSPVSVSCAADVLTVADNQGRSATGIGVEWGIPL